MKNGFPKPLKLNQLRLSDNNEKETQKDVPYSFPEVRNYQAEQEGIFLTLLNQEYDITIEVPQKRSVVTLNYFKIVTLKNERETIQFDQLLSKRLEDLKAMDLSNGVDEKIVMRRFEVNKISESIHLLIEMLIERKYELKTTTMGKRNTRASVVELRFDGISFDRSEIESKGSKIIISILDRMKHMKRKRMLTIEKNDLEFMGLLFS